ncbi:Uncharacterised protein [Legionella steigerwaltii]|uniref:Uncharacterized protein n=1 Tax=Legionella steigerwaltii TaxID=460 RepID=A0A378LB79_9GAMM|nr:hypothetical protein [Legionella steigerwaltii]KTD78545.1 hypothetical protein Lstg_1280 [Legionella steigerwaltii]STY24096.1 Uncharacterised protein [Legionella steigerwaltii]
MSHIDVLIRRSSKGVKFIEQRNDWHPLEVEDEYLKQSISIYDKRIERTFGNHASILSGTGISATDFLSYNNSICALPTVLLLYANIDQDLLVVPLGKEKVKIRNPRYCIGFQEYKSLQEYFGVIGNDAFDFESIMVNATFLLLALSFLILKNIKLVSFYNIGYVLFDKLSFKKFVEVNYQEVKDVIETIFHQTINFNYQHVLSCMKNRSKSGCPFFPPGYFDIGGNQLCIDLDTCTLRLNKLLEHRMQTGSEANLRAIQFEQSLQSLINSSTLEPDEYIKSIIKKKHIKFKSKPITDIDAAFFYKDVLVLISAKSYIFNSIYDQGDYEYIRNIKDRIENDIQKWRCKIEFIKNNPVGDNYDFSNYRVIDGLLCTPSIFFIGANYYKSKINCGLNEYQSAVELYTFLEKYKKLS